jgi:hypothetical protein
LKFKQLVSSITKINVSHIYDHEAASIAQTMSWASTRETLRSEGMAYSLMEIFGVNMPLLYGERHKAFIRLQIAIINSSDDETIFPLAHDALPDTSKSKRTSRTTPRFFQGLGRY